MSRAFLGGSASRAEELDLALHCASKAQNVWKCEADLDGEPTAQLSWRSLVAAGLTVTTNVHRLTIWPGQHPVAQTLPEAHRCACHQRIVESVSVRRDSTGDPIEKALRPGPHDPLQCLNMVEETQLKSVMPQVDKPICDDEIIAFTFSVGA